jgi:hypothetical protein
LYDDDDLTEFAIRYLASNADHAFEETIMQTVSEERYLRSRGEIE